MKKFNLQLTKTLTYTFYKTISAKDDDNAYEKANLLCDEMNDQDIPVECECDDDEAWTIEDIEEE